MYLCEVVQASDEEKTLAERILKYYAKIKGYPRGLGYRVFLYKCKEYIDEYNIKQYICAIALAHEPKNFETLYKKFAINPTNSLLIRKIVKVCPGDFLRGFIYELKYKIRKINKKSILVLSDDSYVTDVLKREGFKVLGNTKKSKTILFSQL